MTRCLPSLDHLSSGLETDAAEDTLAASNAPPVGCKMRASPAYLESLYWRSPRMEAGVVHGNPQTVRIGERVRGVQPAIVNHLGSQGR